MDRWLSKHLLFIFIFFNAGMPLFSQTQEGVQNTTDYKDPKQFERFYKRRNTIAAWQINQLKAGALVVRLKTNHILIEELKKQDNPWMAEKKRLETAAINLNVMRAYLNNYTFSKVYFIFSNYSDTLLNGARTNIFLDTTLSVNPSITMTEKFYMLAESGKVYNSSIGFLPEDSARIVTERGNPTTVEFPIVLKNKYGHQLKKPFPYISGRMPVINNKTFVTTIFINGIYIPFNIGDIRSLGDKKVVYNFDGQTLELNIPRMFTYDVFSLHVEQMNENLIGFYQRNPTPSERGLLYQEARPFLY